MNFETVKNNTLKMIRNNQRYEELIERLVYYARDKQDFELAGMIEQCLKNVEIYE